MQRHFIWISCRQSRQVGICIFFWTVSQLLQWITGAPPASRFRKDLWKGQQHDRQEVHLLEEDWIIKKPYRKIKGAIVVRGADIDCLCRTTEFLGNCLPQPKGMQHLCQAAPTATRHPWGAHRSILFQSKLDGWLLPSIGVGRPEKQNQYTKTFETRMACPRHISKHYSFLPAGVPQQATHPREERHKEQHNHSCKLLQELVSKDLCEPWTAASKREQLLPSQADRCQLNTAGHLMAWERWLVLIPFTQLLLKISEGEVPTLLLFLWIVTLVAYKQHQSSLISINWLSLAQE